MQNLNVYILEELGRGTSGIVYKVRHIVEGKDYVVKVIDLGKLSQKKQAQSMKEVEILKRVNHPHIIRYYDSVIHEKSLFIMTEYASGGDLQKKIDRYKLNKRLLEEGQIWAWTYELSLALKYLHKHKILHRDIKCMNIFLDKSNRIKLGDFGLAKILHNKEIKSSTVGTPLYLSPEQIRHLPYGLKVDIWGLGCVLYKLCALDPPFLGENLNTLGQNIVVKSFKSLPPKFTPKLVSFITNLLEKNPKSRPSVLEVIDQIPVFTKKFYKTPVLLERVLEKKPEEIEKPENPEKTKKTEKPQKSEKLEKIGKIGKPGKSPKPEAQVKPDTKSMFEVDHRADKSEKSVKKIEEIPSSETILPRFSHLVFDRSMQGTLKRLVFNEQRPISQGTNRLVGASSDAVRLSTAYVRQRILKDDKPKTTIGDLARIV